MFVYSKIMKQNRQNCDINHKKKMRKASQTL